MTTGFLYDPVKTDYSEARCAGQDPELFMQWDMHTEARRVCAACPLAADCYFEAVRDNLYGTWGGVWHGKPGKKGVKVNKASTVGLMRLYRAELCERMGMTLEQFVTRYGPSVDGVRRALRSL
jgi:hypothetical protein